MELRNRDTGTMIAGKARRAETFFARLRGLLFAPSLKDDEALHIVPCRSVHTIFMKYPIDVVYLDALGIVVGYDERLEPNRIGTLLPNVHAVVELPAGRIRASRLRIGHLLEFQK
ncbi:DUF192 domain-containing protein [Paenibacillus sp. TRM 82003]|nr:DUF192 domain-containing protein [Paenibacillus sp. TRM 82003]